MSIKILNKESNQLVAITNISESLNKQRVTRQQSAQTKASAPLKIPLCLIHVTTTKSAVRYKTEKLCSLIVNKTSQIRLIYKK